MGWRIGSVGLVLLFGAALAVPGQAADPPKEDVAKLTERLCRLAREVLECERTDEKVVTALFQATVKRPPTADEKSRIVEYFKKSGNRQAACLDILWALINSTEFAKIHRLTLIELNLLGEQISKVAEKK
jgi:hypothetical protein